MKFTSASLLITGASASVIGGYGSPAPAAKNATVSAVPVFVTEVVTALTTFCPEATTFVWGHKTYSVSKPTTLTCPEYTWTHSSYTSKPTVAPVAVVSTTPAAPVVSITAAPVVTKPAYTPAPYPVHNATTPVLVAPSASYTTSSGPIQATANAASNAFAASGAAFAGVFGAVAYLL